ncbi:hypothetical protein, partial [Dysgonomonas sp.]
MPLAGMLKTGRKDCLPANRIIFVTWVVQSVYNTRFLVPPVFDGIYGRRIYIGLYPNLLPAGASNTDQPMNDDYLRIATPDYRGLTEIQIRRMLRRYRSRITKVTSADE